MGPQMGKLGKTGSFKNFSLFAVCLSEMTTFDNPMCNSFDNPMCKAHFSGGSDGKGPAMWESWVRSLGWEDPLEEEMATHSSTLAWRILWTEEPSRLQSTGLQRVRHD